MKITLIILVCLAVVLGVVAYFAVFSGTQVIEPVAPAASQQSSAPTMVLAAPSSSVSTTILTPAMSPSSTIASVYASTFAAPYPVSWSDGGSSTLSIEGATLLGDRLTFQVKVVTGDSYACVPMNLRLVTDEAGDMQAPDTAQFQFADSGGCQGTPHVTYDRQPVVFTVDPTTAPFLFTTGGQSNIFFEVSTTTGNGLQVMIPQQSG
jgi:hypothetical protein